MVVMQGVSAHEKTLRDAIVDLLAYFAVFGLPLTERDIYLYLPVKTTPVAVKVHLERLMQRGKLQKLKDRYGLRKVDYNQLEVFASRQQELLKKAKAWAKLFSLPPFIKSVVLVSSVAYGCPNETSDIDLVVVTSPNRIYLSKAYLYAFFRNFDINSSREKTNRLGISALLTTNGARFERDVYGLDVQRLPWLLSARPLYGHSVWHSLLKHNEFVRANAPNYVWDKTDPKFSYSSISTLDKLDTYGYKRYLRNVAKNPLYHKPEAFVRVRPDIIVINAHHGPYLQTKQASYEQIRQAA